MLNKRRQTYNKSRKSWVRGQKFRFLVQTARFMALLQMCANKADEYLFSGKCLSIFFDGYIVKCV